jgi:hypothetical protein
VVYYCTQAASGDCHGIFQSPLRATTLLYCTLNVQRVCLQACLMHLT